jgi:hypothetical protein
MALINTQPVRVDDLDKTPDAKAHTIVIDGVATEVDLGDINFKLFLAAVDPYLAVGRKLGKGAGAKKSPSPEDKARDIAIRAWHTANGTPLKASGRVSRAARDAWVAAGSPAAA